MDIGHRNWNETTAFRFGGIVRAYGEIKFAKICKAHIAIVGLGGVGSWAAEALVRSGIGEITLIDFDDVCQSNFNRQIMAVSESIGKMKIDVLAERFHSINPDLKINLRHDRLDSTSLDSILETPYTCFLDCIDQAKNKALLIASAKEKKLPLVTVGGSGGKRFPNKIEVADLSQTHGDPLLAKVRRILRTEYRFPSDKRKKMKVASVFSPETVAIPQNCATEEDSSDKKIQKNKPLDCGNGLGTVSMVTGTFGFFAAHLVIEKITCVD